jgi:heme oxygenase
MLLTQLRATTRPFHDSLESRLNILDPGLSRERYFRLLRLFYGFYAPLESRIDAYGDNPDAWLAGDRRKAHLLEDDLRTQDPSQAADQFPVCAQLPETSTPAGQLGCMYVLEGATLGGQVVVRHLRPRLGLNGHGATFFASYGERVGAMWRKFCDHLEGLKLSDNDRGQVVASACATFQSLDHWLCSNGGF